MAEYFKDKFGMDFHISWMITWRCNLSCEYCGVVNINRGLMKGPQGGSLNGEFREKDANVRWKDWVDAFNRFPANAFIDISGGEPFLVPNFIDILEGINERHKIGITTNLTMPIDEFIERVSPKKILQITCSLHLNNKEWNTVFLEKLEKLIDAGFQVQVNFVAYPPQLKFIPGLFKVYKGIIDVQSSKKIEGEILPPIKQWNCSAGNYYSYPLAFGDKIDKSMGSSPTYGFIYKNGATLPFCQCPEKTSFPCGKIEDGFAFISASAYDEKATYKADYYVLEWKKDLTKDEIHFRKKHINGIGFYLEPYAGGAIEPFSGYSDEEITFLNKYWQQEIQSIVRKRIRDVEGKAVGDSRPSPRKKCNAGQHKFMIAPNGLMYPCNMIYLKRRDLCMGDFLQLYLLRKNPIICDLPCTCGGDVGNLIIEYEDENNACSFSKPSLPKTEIKLHSNNKKHPLLRISEKIKLLFNTKKE